VTKILKHFICINAYPDHEEKDKLSRITGLTKNQIENWFKNARRRKWFLELKN